MKKTIIGWAVRTTIRISHGIEFFNRKGNYCFSVLKYIMYPMIRAMPITHLEEESYHLLAQIIKERSIPKKDDQNKIQEPFEKNA